jgi:hypothetical protein
LKHETDGENRLQTDNEKRLQTNEDENFVLGLGSGQALARRLDILLAEPLLMKIWHGHDKKLVIASMFFFRYVELHSLP